MTCRLYRFVVVFNACSISFHVLLLHVVLVSFNYLFLSGNRCRKLSSYSWNIFNPSVVGISLLLLCVSGIVLQLLSLLLIILLRFVCYALILIPEILHLHLWKKFSNSNIWPCTGSHFSNSFLANSEHAYISMWALNNSNNSTVSKFVSS